MKKLVGLFGLLALFVAPVLAQDNPAPPQDQAPTAPTAPTEPVKVKRTYITPRYEISGGFTLRSFYSANGLSVNMPGGFGSFDYNFLRWLGLEGEGLAVGGTVHFPDFPPEDVKIYTLMGGPKLYPLGHRKITPFGHLLFGAGIDGTSVPAFSGYPGNSGGKVVSAWEVGGGFDYSLKSRWGIRLFQFDYGNAKFLGNNVSGQGSKRISFGVVYRWGQR